MNLKYAHTGWGNRGYPFLDLLLILLLQMIEIFPAVRGRGSDRNPTTGVARFPEIGKS